MSRLKWKIMTGEPEEYLGLGLISWVTSIGPQEDYREAFGYVTCLEPGTYSWRVKVGGLLLGEGLEASLGGGKRKVEEYLSLINKAV